VESLVSTLLDFAKKPTWAFVNRRQPSTFHCCRLRGNTVFDLGGVGFGGGFGSGGGGSKRKHQSYFLNNVEVCGFCRVQEPLFTIDTSLLAALWLPFGYPFGCLLVTLLAAFWLNFLPLTALLLLTVAALWLPPWLPFGCLLAALWLPFWLPFERHSTYDGYYTAGSHQVLKAI